VPDLPQYLGLTCLTPVHVGTGTEYVAGVDFIARGNNTYLLDSERVLEKLYASGQLPRDPGDLKSKVERMFERERPEDCALARCSGTVGGDLKVRAAIRAGDGRPIIPGSSLKGALRTLIFVGRVGKDGPHDGMKPSLEIELSRAAEPPRAKFAARMIEERLFCSSTAAELGLGSNDAKADLLRLCSVSDAYFAPDAAQVVITAAVGTTRRNTTVGAEVLTANAKAAIQFRLGLLYAESMFTEHLPSWDVLAGWSRRHAMHLLETDLLYFAKPQGEPRRDCAKVIESLEAIKLEIGRAKSDTMFLRLGWGTGWRTMTGDVQDASQRKHLLEKSNEFGPKTRKVIIADGAQSAAAVKVLGWISLEPISPEAARELNSKTRPGAPRVPVSAAQLEPIAAASFSGDQFIQGLSRLRPSDWGRLSNLYAQAEEGKERRNARLEALALKIAEVWGRDSKRLAEARQKFSALAPYWK